MKKPALIAGAALLLLAGSFFVEQRPFRGLEAGEITAASVHLFPPDVTVDLEPAEIETLAELLREVRLTHRDDSYTEYSGQAVVFTLTMADGTVTEAVAYAPFFIIDGVGYRTAYEPCEALNRFGNLLLES